jgi:toxin ParE1/3/4
MKIEWTRRATRHLRAAYDYWSRERSPEAAQAMLRRIFSEVELLTSNPELGRAGRTPGTRELVLAPMPFVLAYRIHKNKIDVLAVLHGSRKWPGRF